MASLSARPASELAVGRHGLVGVTAGARLRVVAQRQLVSVTARRGDLESLRSAVRKQFGVDLPDEPLLVRGSRVSFVWCGHQQWFAIVDEGTDLLSALRQHVGGSASLSDQSDSRLIVELSGSAARAILAKLAPIDLDPHAFPAGATALTLLEHVGAQITLTGEGPTFELMAFRSFADSILHAVLTAGAEFGIDVVA